MNTSKRNMWPAAAVAAAALFSAGAARADHRGDFGSDRNFRGYGDEHHRVWRDHDRRYFEGHYEPRYYWYPSHRYYRDYRPHRYYYGYSPYDYWPERDFGARLDFEIPLF